METAKELVNTLENELKPKKLNAVFDPELCIANGKELGLDEETLETCKNSWIKECTGLTKGMMRLLGWHIDDSWFRDVEVKE